MLALFMIGRIVLGAYFVMSGMNHFTKREMLSKYAQSKGLKGSSGLVVLTGIMMLLGGIGLLLGVFVEVAVTLLVVFLVVVSFTMHRFWSIEDEENKMVEMRYFMSNIALAGAILMLLQIATPWALSL